MDPWSALEGGLIATTIFIVAGSIVGAIVLRGAVSLANNTYVWNDSAPKVPMPRFPAALLIMFLISVVIVVPSFFIGFFYSAGMEAAGADLPSINPTLAASISIPLSFLAMVAMLKLFLPTTFGRAIVVSLWYQVIVAAVLGIVIAVSFLLL